MLLGRNKLDTVCMYLLKCKECRHSDLFFFHPTYFTQGTVASEFVIHVLCFCCQTWSKQKQTDEIKSDCQKGPIVRHCRVYFGRSNFNQCSCCVVAVWEDKSSSNTQHDDVIKWKHFPRYWPFVGEFSGPGEFPAQRPVTRSFDAFFDLRPNKRPSKQPWGWWFEMLSWSLWRQCNEIVSFCWHCVYKSYWFYPTWEVIPPIKDPLHLRPLWGVVFSERFCCIMEAYYTLPDDLMPFTRAKNTRSQAAMRHNNNSQRMLSG